MVYPLLQNVLFDAFNVSTAFFSPPYENTNKIDFGLRSAVWMDFDSTNDKILFVNSTERYRILIIKSNLGFYNILITLGLEEKPDFISIGPFRTDEISPYFFTQIMKESHISSPELKSIKNIYERMPLVNIDAIVNVTKHILKIYIPEFSRVTPELLEYSEQKRTVKINSALLAEASIEDSLQYQQLLFTFLDSLKLGDQAGAKKALQIFLQETRILLQKNLRDSKITLQLLNDYCHMALLQTSIHPFYVLRQSISFNTQIANTTSLTKLAQIPGEICHKYCLLVKNYSHPEYSKLTRDVIAYIQIHLNEELSLNHLADHFHRNASVLSNIFSKETGITLTKFIHQARIREAILLFNTTGMSVSEVATTVGYHDFSYFSKVFSRNIGCSPQQYKQQK